MVDLSTAMTAAQGERRQRKPGDGKEKKVRRTGRNLGIESFDPVKHVAKEKADMASMWLVLGFALLVTLLMRYVLMDVTDPENSKILYILPLTCIFLIPTLHRTIMPERFVEHYGGGTWFKAAFLHTFTFLALSFLLVNPPFGDIAAPELAKSWTVVADDGETIEYPFDVSTKGTTLTWHTNGSTTLQGDAWLLFGLMDNKNSDGASVVVEREYQANVTTRDVNESYWYDNAEAIKNGTSSSNKSSPNLTPHGDQDQPFAIFLGTDLGEGTHTITVTITEEGDPWKNVQTYRWTLEIINVSPFDQDSISE
ncbi:MAG: hypothetical protein L7U53_01235 [Candidatus Poseidoniaceae archaeon]|nr:hypothetical protein [Candidatus Poseidoniaceae archaeon]